MTFAQSHALIQVGHMPVLPVWLLAILSWGIGCFHKSPFEIMVGLLGSVPITDFASTAYSACITRQLLSPRKPFHKTDLRTNHNGENVAHARDGFEELHVGSQRNALLHPFFHDSNLLLHLF